MCSWIPRWQLGRTSRIVPFAAKITDLCNIHTNQRMDNEESDPLECDEGQEWRFECSEVGPLHNQQRKQGRVHSGNANSRHFLGSCLPTAVVNTNLLSCNGDGVGFDPQHPQYGKFNPCLCLRSEVVARYFQSYIFEGEITIRFLVYFLALNKILQHPGQTDLQLFN